MKIKTVASLAFLMVANTCTSTAPAHAQQQQCAEREVIVDVLFDKYNEVPVTMGLADSGHFVETFASAKTGTWTVVATYPDGVACLILSGQSFEMLGFQNEIKGEPL